jgi:hypothetical protein
MFARVIHQFQMSTTGAADSSQDNTRGLDDSGNLRREPPANQEKGRKQKMLLSIEYVTSSSFLFPWTMDSRHFIFWTIQNALV